VFGELCGYFDEAQMVALTANIARENHRTRFNDAVGMGYGGFSEGSYCLLSNSPGDLRREERKRMNPPRMLAG
jgi:hypothetical protein